jgi:hypothetical protein
MKCQGAVVNGRQQADVPNLRTQNHKRERKNQWVSGHWRKRCSAISPHGDDGDEDGDGSHPRSSKRTVNSPISRPSTTGGKMHSRATAETSRRVLGEVIIMRQRGGMRFSACVVGGGCVCSGELMKEGSTCGSNKKPTNLSCMMIDVVEKKGR